MNRVMITLGAGALLAVSAACGNASSTKVTGEVGLSRDAHGHVLALIATCGSTVAALDIAGSREGLHETQVNPTLGAFVASRAASGTIRLDLEGENRGWKTTKRFSPAAVPTESVLVTAFDREADSQTRQTTVTREQLETLEPGGVLRADGSTVTEARFTSEACS